MPGISISLIDSKGVLYLQVKALLSVIPFLQVLVVLWKAVVMGWLVALTPQLGLAQSLLVIMKVLRDPYCIRKTSESSSYEYKSYYYWFNSLGTVFKSSFLVSVLLYSSQVWASVGALL